MLEHKLRPPMRVWLDTEFIDKGHKLDANLDLISIGLVREDGKELYLENAGVNMHELTTDPWLKDNVVPKLGEPKDRLFLPEIAETLEMFCADIKPEFWAYYVSYDWLMVCKIFQGMLKLPKGWSHLCRDVKQYIIHLGVDDKVLPAPFQKETERHHALNDARWLKDYHLWFEARYILKPIKRETILLMQDLLQTDLDEIVCQMKAEEASSINNDGRDSQIEYILNNDGEALIHQAYKSRNE